MPAFIAHGRQDTIMSIEFARSARETLEGAGFAVEYHESDAAHFIDPDHVPNAVNWVSEAVSLP
jgi:phospholipase/carboxylesterase